MQHLDAIVNSSWLISAWQRIAPDLRRVAQCARDCLVRGMENCTYKKTTTQFWPATLIDHIIRSVIASQNYIKGSHQCLGLEFAS